MGRARAFPFELPPRDGEDGNEGCSREERRNVKSSPTSLSSCIFSYDPAARVDGNSG